MTYPRIPTPCPHCGSPPDAVLLSRVLAGDPAILDTVREATLMRLATVCKGPFASEVRRLRAKLAEMEKANGATAEAGQ